MLVHNEAFMTATRVRSIARWFMRGRLTSVIILFLCALAPAELTYAPADPAARGGLTGTIRTTHDIQTVLAFEPFERKVYKASVASGTGRFALRGLPPGEYDLLIKTVGHVYEGLSLQDDEQPALEGRRLQAACDQVSPFIFETEDYFNRKHIVRLAASEDQARALVVQTRTRPVVDPGGTPIDAHIRRFDFVELVKTRQVWQITTSRHLLRQEVPYRSKDTKLAFTHSPKLARIAIGETIKDLGVFELRRLPRSRPGRYGTARHAQP